MYFKFHLLDEKKHQRHPQLVSRVTGRANLIEIMKHFPYLSVDQVSLVFLEHQSTSC